MADATLVSDARTTLYDALVVELADWPWRVHRVVPTQLVAPSVFLDSVEVVNESPMTTATFPVVVVVDGLERRQVEQLDDLVAHIWDAAYRAHGQPRESHPTSLDVGGPNLRAQVVRVDMTIPACTLTLPALATVGGTP